MSSIRPVAALTVLILLWGSTPPAAAQSTPVSVSGPVSASVLTDVAFDSQNQVYLQIFEGARNVWGRFYHLDGSPAGSPFIAALNIATFAGRPKVAAGGGKFLVTYISDINDPDRGTNVFGQIVRYTGAGGTGGQLEGAPIFVSPNSGIGSAVMSTSDAGFNPLTQRFVVLYDEYLPGALGREVLARQFALDGTPVGGPQNVSSGPGHQGAGTLVLDWERNSFCVVYMGDNPANPNQAGIFAQLLDGNTLAPSGGMITVAIGFTIEATVAFLPEADGFLVTWTAFNATRDVVGRFIPTATGTPGVAYAVIANPSLNEGAAVLDYDYVSRKVIVAAMSDTLRIIGSVMTASGASPTSSYPLSTVATDPTTGQALAFGSFNPAIAPASGVVGLTYIIEYRWAYLERHQLPAATTPGPVCCDGVPQPQTSFTVSPTSWSAPTAGGSEFITVTAPTASSTWTATSSDPTWLTVSPANGVGSGSVTLTATPNPFAGPRAATVNVAGSLVLVSQAVGGGITLPVGRPQIRLDGDASGDVLGYSPSTGQWARLLTQPGGGFAQSLGNLSPGLSILPAEFNGDGLVDLFVSDATTGQWSKMLNTGTGFSVAASGGWWPGWQKHVLELNGDGISDVFLYDPVSGQWFKCLSIPTGFTYYQGEWNPAWEITPMNLNGDSLGDLFLINRTTGQWFWVLGASGGTFSYPLSQAWDPDWQLYPGDFNGDGLEDLYLTRPSTGQYFVATNTGTGFTYASGGWSLGWTPWVADLDGDGAADLFLHDPATGQWFEMTSDRQGHFANRGGGFWTLGWQLFPTDFNGDGRADFLLYNPTTGQWFQAWNFVAAAFSYFGGGWNPGLTTIAGTSRR